LSLFGIDCHDVMDVKKVHGSSNMAVALHQLDDGCPETITEAQGDMFVCFINAGLLCCLQLVCDADDNISHSCKINTAVSLHDLGNECPKAVSETHGGMVACFINAHMLAGLQLVYDICDSCGYCGQGRNLNCKKTVKNLLKISQSLPFSMTQKKRRKCNEPK